MSTSRIPRSARRRVGGFTLVELLVVIGIIVLLFSIATPIIMTARRNAERVRTQGDLNTIAMALDAYKADFKDYPRPDLADPTRPVLAWALIGPWDAVAAGGNPGDGADGPGFRTQWNVLVNPPVGSKVFGPYLPPEKFNTEILNGNVYLLDRYGTRIEYFPQWKSAKPGVKLFGVQSGDPIGGGLAGNGGGVYDWRQATPPRPEEAGDSPSTQSRAIYYLQRALGDGINGTHDDLIGSGETPLTQYPPYLLLSRGHSRMFSSKEEIDTKFSKTGEVSNVQVP
jgi:prepilin-type N-terminal cleavage/methylation domain-containing protein